MADYVELICLCILDSEISLNEAVSWVYHSAEVESSREVEVEENPSREQYVGDLKDNQLKAGIDWFRQLEYRQTVFNDYYPFCVENDRLIFKYDISIKHSLYIYLLLCSNLRLIKRSFWPSLTTNFEILSAEVLKSYLPSFTVQHFGKSLNTERNYSNKLSDAIPQLAENLNETNVSDPKDFSDKNTGDGGLDVVAWRRPGTDDKAPGSLICFAQCACSPEDWVDKQFESHPAAWRNRIIFAHDPANFIFVPICFRDSRGNWFSKDKIRSSVLMDRLRICSLLLDSMPPLDVYGDAVDTIYMYSEEL